MTFNEPWSMKNSMSNVEKQIKYNRMWIPVQNDVQKQSRKCYPIKEIARTIYTTVINKRDNTREMIFNHLQTVKWKINVFDEIRYIARLLNLGPKELKGLKKVITMH